MQERIQQCNNASIQKCNNATMQKYKNAIIQYYKNVRMQECNNATSAKKTIFNAVGPMVYNLYHVTEKFPNHPFICGTHRAWRDV